MKNDTLIIIPAYNEEEAINDTVMSLSSYNVDVLVVNDGSTDNTLNVLKNIQTENFSYITLPINSGIGAGMQTGFIYANRHNYEYAVQFDGDGQHSSESLIKLLSHAKDNDLDLCVGSRFLDKDNPNFKSSTLRRVGINFFSFLISFLTKTKVTDPTSGYRVYGKRAVAFFAKYYPDDYPEPEVLFWCAKNRFRVGEITVQMNERQGGVSSIQRLKTVYYMVKVTISILIDKLRESEV